MSLRLTLRVRVFGEWLEPVHLLQTPSTITDDILNQARGNEAIAARYIEFVDGSGTVNNWEPSLVLRHIRQVWMYGTHANARWGVI